MIKEIKFTDKAIKQINNLLSKKDPGSFFRIAIKGGGCSGFQYEFTFDKKLGADDLQHENILIDKTEKSFKFYDTQGLKLPLLRAGKLGNEARAIGGSLLPLQKQFGLDQSLILKSSLDP